MKLLFTGLLCGLLLGCQYANAVANKNAPRVADLQEHNRILQTQVKTGKVRAKRLLASYPVLVEVRAMPPKLCPTCGLVEAKLATDGVKTEFTTTAIQLATSYPACVFSDGTWDNGGRVLDSQYQVKGPVKVTEYTPLP